MSDNKVLFIITLLTLFSVIIAVMFNIFNISETLIFYGFLTIFISLIILDKYR